jgi:hypothetical protein
MMHYPSETNLHRFVMRSPTEKYLNHHCLWSVQLEYLFLLLWSLKKHVLDYKNN